MKGQAFFCSTIFVAIRRGRLNARKAGRRTVVLTEDLEQFLMQLPRVRVKGIELQEEES